MGKCYGHMKKIIFLARDLDHQKLTDCYKLKVSGNFKGYHAEIKKER